MRLLALLSLQSVSNFCAYRMLEQSLMNKRQETVLYGSFIAATCIMAVLSLVTFVTFTRTLRHLLKYLKTFDKDV